MYKTQTIGTYLYLIKSNNKYNQIVVKLDKTKRKYSLTRSAETYLEEAGLSLDEDDSPKPVKTK